MVSNESSVSASLTQEHPPEPDKSVKIAAEKAVTEVGVRSSTREDVVEEASREVMAHTSPDGRSPDSAGKARGSLVLVLAMLTSLGIGALILMFVVGGTIAMVVGIVYVCMLFGASIPVWGAGLLRQHEEHDAQKEVSRVVRRRRRVSWYRSENT
jgi:hypothetical protein